MLHCVVVMFTDSQKPPFYTGWVEERDTAFDIARRSSVGKDRIAYVSWSYYYPYTKDEKTIKRKLHELAKSMVGGYQDVALNRNAFKKLYDGILKNPDPVQVFHRELTETTVFGFAYARCT